MKRYKQHHSPLELSHFPAEVAYRLEQKMREYGYGGSGEALAIGSHQQSRVSPLTHG